MLLKKRYLVAAAVVLGAIASGVWYYSRFAANFVISGKVIDQDGNPVTNATLQFESWEFKTLLPLPPYGVNYRSSLQVSCTTDSLGQFSIGSPRETLHLTGFSKPGFVLGPIMANPEWPNKPNTWRFHSRTGVVLYAYDDTAAKPTLLSVNRKLMLKPDETPFLLSFANPSTEPQPGNADMSLSFDGEILSVRIPTGGLWVGTNEFLYAPKSDYLPGVDCRIRNPGRNDYLHWAHTMLFYARTGNQQTFARGRLRIKNVGDDLEVAVEASVNPTGSRDLRGAKSFPEPDPDFGHSERIDLGTTPWWKQGQKVTPVH